jgi:hypothetical protein
MLLRTLGSALTRTNVIFRDIDKSFDILDANQWIDVHRENFSRQQPF